MAGFSGRMGCCLIWASVACGKDPVDRALDEDGDGVGYAQDCDDDDATVGAPGLLYLDADGDGVGSQPVEVCPGLSGWVAQDGDCDDQDATVFPGAPERCNGLDDDCDGLVDQDDDDLPLTDLDWYFVDADGDGWGAEAAQACAPTDGYSDREGDCDDGAASVHPEAPERCGNGIDDDCSGDANACDPPAAATTAHAAATWLGETGAGGGSFLASAGDFDGDGLPDLLVGSPLSGEGDGGAVTLLPARAPLASGRLLDGLRWVGASDTWGLGRAADGVGDLDGDGLAEIALGAPASDRIWLVPGESPPTPGDRAIRTVPTGLLGAPGDGFGVAVAGLGDLDGDGRLDFAVGAAYGASDAGEVWLIAGSNELPASDQPVEDVAWARISGQSAYDGFAGTARAIAHSDLDGDGLADLCVGASSADGAGADSGSVAVFLGGSGWPADLAAADADQHIDGPAPTGTEGYYGPAFGTALQALGDWTGDGRDDLAVSAIYDDAAGENAGAVYLMAGAAALPATLRATDAWAILQGDGLDARLGVSMAAGAQGDARWLLVGGGRLDDEGVRTRLAWRLSSAGADTGVHGVSAAADATFEGAGNTVALLDMDGDGRLESIVGGADGLWLFSSGGL